MKHDGRRARCRRDIGDDAGIAKVLGRFRLVRAQQREVGVKTERRHGDGAILGPFRSFRGRFVRRHVAQWNDQAGAAEKLCRPEVLEAVGEAYRFLAEVFI